MNYISFQSGSLVKRPDTEGFTWILRYRADGKQRALKLGTSEEFPTEKEARRKAADMIALINDRTPRITFSQLVEKYIKEEIPSRPDTAASYRSALKRLTEAFGKMSLDDLLRDLMAIQNWVGDLKTLPTKKQPARIASKKTKQNVKAVLHRLIECAMKWGYIPVDRNPVGLVEVRVSGPQPKKRKKRPLTVKQIGELLKYPGLAHHVKVMVELSIFMGLRISEVLGLKWDDIDLEGVDGGVIRIMRSAVGNHIDETKTPDSRTTLPIHPELVKLLSVWREQSLSKNGWVFESAITNRPFHRDSLQADHLRPAGEALGIPNLGWHTFRHTQIAHLRKNKIAAEVQMMLMRHADMHTTNEYGRDDESPDSVEVSLKRAAHEALVNKLLDDIKAIEQ